MGAGPGGAGRVVLLAEDDADVRELVAFRLRRAGYRVIAVRDGERALAAAREQAPDICLIDVMMPGLDGYAVTECLRASPGLGSLPIVLLTASVDEAAISRGFAAGASDYVTKPFAHEELLARIAAALERSDL